MSVTCLVSTFRVPGNTDHTSSDSILKYCLKHYGGALFLELVED